MIAVDTNILVYAHRQEFPEHGVARRTLIEIAEGVLPFGIPTVVVGEFLRVATHPRILDPPTARGDALAVLDGVLTSPRARVLGPTSSFWPTLRSLVDDLRLSGNAVFDAQVAATCLVNGFTTLVTNDRDFRRFPGLEVRGLDLT